jgi:DNA primase
MVDLDTLKSQLHPASVVAQYTHQEPRPNKNIRCVNQRAHPNGDADPSCSMDYSSGLWKCFGCGAQGDILDFVGYALYSDYDHRTRPHFKQLIDALAGVQIQPMPELERIHRQHFEQPVIKLRLDKSQLMDWTDNLLGQPTLLRWLERRGVTEVIEHRIGYTGDDPTLEQWQQHKIVIPHFYRGVLTGIKVRYNPHHEAPVNPKTGKKRKYVSFTGSSYSVPYNADCLNYGQKMVFVIETELDAIALMELLQTDAVIAIPAGSFTADFASMLITARRVVAVMDNDEAGQRMGREIKRYIGRARVMHPPREYKDLGEWMQGEKVNPYWFLGGAS